MLNRMVLGGAVFAVLGVVSTSTAATKTSSLPDWSGVWENVSGIHMTEPLVNDGGKAGARGHAVANPPPLNAEYQKAYDAVLASAKQGKPVNDPTANCVWPGVPRVIVSPYPSEFLFTPHRVTILYEYMGQVRRIRTDGSKHPADLEPTYNGDSIGHWEGQTLVVDTVGLRADTMYQNTGLPHSDALHLSERIHLGKPGELIDEMTFDDPKAMTKPWKAVWRYQRHRDWQILDYVCEENNRNPNINGVTVAR